MIRETKGPKINLKSEIEEVYKTVLDFKVVYDKMNKLLKERSHIKEFDQVSKKVSQFYFVNRNETKKIKEIKQSYESIRSELNHSIDCIGSKYKYDEV